MPHPTHPRARGELAPISALVSPGMEVGVGGLSTWLLELKLRVMLKIGCLQRITDISLLPALSFSLYNYAVLSDTSGVFGTSHAARMGSAP